jgi:hypothetical protein
MGEQINIIEFSSKQFSEIFTEFVTQLKEMVRCMEDNDIVSLGDLLEYEISPLLPQFEPYTKEIVERCRILDSTN